MKNISDCTQQEIGETLNISPELSQMVQGVVDGSVNPEHFESSAQLPEDAAQEERQMAALNEIVGGRGVETVNGDKVVATKTIIFKARDAQFCLGNWGELVRER